MADNFGLPKISINFKSTASTAFIESKRGTVALVLHDDALRDESIFFNVTEAGEIPIEITSENAEYIKLALGGAPQNILGYVIPPESYEIESEVATTTTIQSEMTITVPVTQEAGAGEGSAESGGADLDDLGGDEYETQTVISDVTVPTTTTVTVTVQSAINLNSILAELGDMQFNWIACPDGNAQNQKDLAAWVKSQRKNKNKTFKAVVANYSADDEGVVNFTTDDIKVENPAYTDALTAAGGDESLVEVEKYITYNATQFTARIAGLLAGLSFERSATYYGLADVVSVKRYEDIDEHINTGEMCLFNEYDGNGVKIARACNSLITFTATHGESFRHVRTVEIIDFIADSIRNTFKKDYLGKVVNNYDNKKLLISAIGIFFNELTAESVLDSDGENYVEIDLEKNSDWAKLHSVDITGWTEEEIRRLNTGENVFLSGKVTPLGAMESLTINFALN